MKKQLLISIALLVGGTLFGAQEVNLQIDWNANAPKMVQGFEEILAHETSLKSELIPQLYGGAADAQKLFELLHTALALARTGDGVGAMKTLHGGRYGHYDLSHYLGYNPKFGIVHINGKEYNFKAMVNQTLLGRDPFSNPPGSWGQTQ